jgi:hypothetical protein
MKLQGARRIRSQSGKDCVVIELGTSRAKPHQNGSVYLSLEAVENKNGAGQYGDTHFVTEPTTKEERQSGMKLPIIGNGKEWRDNPLQQQSRPAARTEQRQPTREPMHREGGFNDEEIPF